MLKRYIPKKTKPNLWYRLTGRIYLVVRDKDEQPYTEGCQWMTLTEARYVCMGMNLNGHPSCILRWEDKKDTK